MNLEEIKSILQDEKSYRFNQVFSAIFKQLASSWQNTNLSQNLKKKLEEKASLEIQAEIIGSKKQNIKKALITLGPGEKIETVLISHQSGRNTVCVSSQIGCPLKCSFCASSKSKFKRNLNYSEIITQIIFWARILKDENKKVTNIVFMGMGEPLLNYQSVDKAVRLINDESAFNISSRKISISTVGIIDGINKLATRRPSLNLAFSLHAPDQDLRQRIIPSAKNYPLQSIFLAISKYIRKTKRKVMIEYALFDKINDDTSLAYQLAYILKKNFANNFVLNLIAGNPVFNYKPSSHKQIYMFKKVLEEKNIEVVERYRFGRNIKGACGQLVYK